MSRKSSSGAFASIAAAASVMLPASAMISTQGNSARSRRNSRRARGSSSTIIAFMGPLLGGLWNANTRERPIGVRQIEIQQGSAPEQQSQPLGGIAQADAVRGRLAGRCGTRVLDFDEQRAVAHIGADPQHTPL